MTDNNSNTSGPADDSPLRICGWMQFKHQETGDIRNSPAIAVYLSRPVAWGEKTRMAINSRSPVANVAGNWDDVRHATWASGQVEEAKKWAPMGFTPNDPSIKPLLVAKIGGLLAVNAKEMAKKKPPERRIHLCRFDHWLNGWGTDLVWDPLKDLGPHSAPELLKMAIAGELSGDASEVCEHWLSQPVAQEAKKKAYGSKYPTKATPPAPATPAPPPARIQTPPRPEASAPSLSTTSPAVLAQASSSTPKEIIDEPSPFDEFPSFSPSQGPSAKPANGAEEQQATDALPNRRRPVDEPSIFDDFPPASDANTPPTGAENQQATDALANGPLPADEPSIFDDFLPASEPNTAPSPSPQINQRSEAERDALPAMAPAETATAPQPSADAPQMDETATPAPQATAPIQPPESPESLEASIFGGADLPDFSRIALSAGMGMPPKRPADAASPAKEEQAAPALQKSGVVDFSFARLPAHGNGGEVHWQTCLLACSGYMPKDVFAVARKFQAGSRQKGARQEMLYGHLALPALVSAGFSISVDGREVDEKFLSQEKGRAALDAPNFLLSAMARSPHQAVANIASLARAKFYRDKISALISSAPREPSEEDPAEGWIQLSPGPARRDATRAHALSGLVRWTKSGSPMMARLAQEIDRSKLARLCEGYALAQRLCFDADGNPEGMPAPGSTPITPQAVNSSPGGKP